MQLEEFWLRMATIKGMGPKRLMNIAQTVLATGNINPIVLREAGLNEVQNHQFWQVMNNRITHVLRWLEQPEHHLLIASDVGYPFQLAMISGFPLVLYVEGDPQLLCSAQLAVVGSRHCSAYGRQWGKYFCQALAVSGLTLTSGLAQGIDGIAHQAALDVEGKTIAVLGNGLQCCYPVSHQKLAREIVERGGTLVSEFFLDTPPLAVNFPRRNRIISGLSRGVLVIEAMLRSGSLVTARYALEQNRNVYALPGAIGNPGSEGVHWLIQQGALLVAHPNNIIEDLNSSLNWLPLMPSVALHSIKSEETAPPFADVLANVSDEITSVDVIAERVGQPVSVIAGKLLELELAGWIIASSGGYIRLHSDMQQNFSTGVNEVV